MWNTFSPTLGFSTIRTLISLMCDPKWMIDNYDLSGAFLGTKLEDREMYMRLPPESGKYPNKVLRLEKSIRGLKSAVKAFMNQYRYMYRYRDELGREMIFASYVDDIICYTTDTGLRERFFDHLRKIWTIECRKTSVLISHLTRTCKKAVDTVR